MKGTQKYRWVLYSRLRLKKLPYLGHACPLKEGVPLQFVFAVMELLGSGVLLFLFSRVKKD